MIFDDITAQILRIDEANNRIQAANNRVGAALQIIQSKPPAEGGLTQAQAQQVLASVTFEADAGLNIANQVEASAALAEQIANS